VAAVQERGAHAGLEGEDPVAHPEGAAAAPHPPALLVEPFVRQGLAALVRDGQSIDVPHEIPNQVAAGRPGREDQLGRGALRQSRHLHLDVEFVTSGIRHRDAVPDWRQWQ
jgi:hypothetical protein